MQFKPVLRATVIGLLALLLLVAVPARETGAVVLEISDPGEYQKSLGDSFWLNLEALAEFQHRKSSRTDPQATVRQRDLEATLTLQSLYRSSQSWQLDTELELYALNTQSNPDRFREDNEQALRLTRLSLDILPTDERQFGLRLGRQYIEDERTWWFDQPMDMLRVYLDADDWVFSFAAGREALFGEDLLDLQKEQTDTWYIVSAGFESEASSQTSLYLMKQRLSRSDDPIDPLYLGMQHLAQWGESARYWLDGAWLTGSVSERDLTAYAFDAGVSFRLESAWQPYFTFSQAIASGDKNPDDSEQKDFRQTGLQGNESGGFGLADYQYYGELTDFELANIQVTTVGMGVTPNPRFSAELLYHNYSQTAAQDTLYDSALQMEPSGLHKHLGRELDLILAYAVSEDVTLKLLAAAFEPGRAFPSSAQRNWLGRLEVAWEF